MTGQVSSRWIRTWLHTCAAIVFLLTAAATICQAHAWAFARGDTYCVRVDSPDFNIYTQTGGLRLPLECAAYCTVDPQGRVLLATEAGKVYCVESVKGRVVSLHLERDVSPSIKPNDAVLSFDYDGRTWIFECMDSVLVQSDGGERRIPIVACGGGAPELLFDDSLRHNTTAPEYDRRLYPMLYRGRIVCSGATGLYELQDDGTYKLVYDYWKAASENHLPTGEAIISRLFGDTLYLIYAEECGSTWFPRLDGMLVVDLATGEPKERPLGALNDIPLDVSVRPELLSVLLGGVGHSVIADFDPHGLTLLGTIPMSDAPEDLPEATVLYK